MIFSLRKKQDMENRANMLEAMEIALRHDHVEIAKSFGESSHALAEKIAKDDYQPDIFDRLSEKLLSKGVVSEYL